MAYEDLLIHGTAWGAFGCYLLAGFPARGDDDDRRSRRIWCTGLFLFLLHVVAAFHWRHGWSHERALDDTARQTAALTGVEWGGGLWLNYLFLAVWSADAVCWEWVRRHLRVHRSIQGFLLFMWFNATVVFGSWPMRIVGALGFLILGVLWWLNHQRRANRLRARGNLD